MDIGQLLAQSGGIGQMARELGVDEATAQQGAQALLPAVLGGMRNQAESHPQGLGGLAGMLGGLGGGGLLDSVLSPQPTDVSQGNGVLGQIFGSKDVSRTVATNAAQQSGLSPDLLKRMLPFVAMLAAGYFAKQAGGGGGGLLGNLAGAAMGGNAGMGSGIGGGMGGMLGSLLGMGGGQPNPLNQILGGLGR